MTISTDLFLSILSMDAYNRGYDHGIEGLGGIGSQIGTATISSQSESLTNTPASTPFPTSSAREWTALRRAQRQ